jgi:alkanesulfonate monooxygenase SsuD/methylene tetrahydromethanopterin reductase-like flavin-dependent oxidoreductase (luciferase family)
VCAETDEEAHYLASSNRMTFTIGTRGQSIPVPPPEKAIKFLDGEECHRRKDGQLEGTGKIEHGKQIAPGRRGIIGSPSTVRAGLQELADSYQTDELIVVTITYDHLARRRSYELLARAMGLAAR